jgi:HEAT repeat protein
VLPVELLQRQEPWQFDLISAIIGAVAAWLIALFLYRNRAGIKKLGETLWSPIAELRRRSRTSQEEKYLHTLQEALPSLLLFEPQDPQAIFQPPDFAAPPPLPTTAADADELPEPLRVRHSDLLDGYERTLITGPLGSGRTTALAMLVWEVAARLQDEDETDSPLCFPVWIDLSQLKDLPEEEDATPLRQLEQLVTLFMPDVLPKWLHQHLEEQAPLLLIDNWEDIPPDERGLVALWISDVAERLPNSRWIIATGEQGYGPLVEVGFVPLTLVPPTGEATLLSLYRSWARLYESEAPAEDEGEEEVTSPPEEALQALKWAQQAGGSLMELNTRIVVYRETQMIPTRPVDVLDLYLDTHIPALDLGEDQEEMVNQARMLALNTLGYVASTRRLEGRAPTRQEVLDVIGEMMPPEEDRPPKLESTVRRLLNESGMIRREGKAWYLTHYLWEDFLTAWELVEDEGGADLVQAHLNDPNWRLLIEFYVGLGDATSMVRALLKQAATENDREVLLRLARWSVISPEDVSWLKTLMKALAQSFMTPNLPPSLRLSLGRALALTAGEGARAFFIKALRHPALDIRAAALRGIGWTGSAREMPILSGALSDEDLETRTSAVDALAEMGTPGAVRVLSDALYQVDERTSLAVAEALASLQRGHEALQEATTHQDLLVRRAAATGLGLIDQPWATEMLEQMVREDDEWLVRSAAETALNRREERAETQDLVLAPPQIDQIDWLITWAARQGEGVGVGDAAMEILNRAVAEGPPEVKILGAMTLGQIGRESHLQTLRPLLKDPEPAVRAAAEDAIRRIEGRYHTYQSAY